MLDGPCWGGLVALVTAGEDPSARPDTTRDSEAQRWSHRSTRRPPASCSRRTATCRCTSGASSCSRSPRAPGATTSARCSSRCATSRRSHRSSSSTPTAPCAPAASWCGRTTSSSTSSTTSGTARCPSPAGSASSSSSASRLHSTRLAWERPLWEAHVIEGLRDGRVAMYTKTHHALVDGISAMRLLASVLSTDPDERGMARPVGSRPGHDAQQEVRGPAASPRSRCRRCAPRSASPPRRPACRAR